MASFDDILLSDPVLKEDRDLMSETEDFTRRTFGALYWLPIPVGILITLYAGICFQGYWDSGNSRLLSMGIWAFSCGATLIRIGVRSYILAVMNMVLAFLNAIVVVQYRQWPFLYLSFMCVVFAGVAAIPRRTHTETRPGETK